MLKVIDQYFYLGGGDIELMFFLLVLTYILTKFVFI